MRIKLGRKKQFFLDKKMSEKVLTKKNKSVNIIKLSAMETSKDREEYEKL